MPLRKYPTAKITAHTIRTSITYAVRVFKDFSTGRLGGIARCTGKTVPDCPVLDVLDVERPK
jgi:hypothetical protein